MNDISYSKDVKHLKACPFKHETLINGCEKFGLKKDKPVNLKRQIWANRIPPFVSFRCCRQTDAKYIIFM